MRLVTFGGKIINIVDASPFNICLLTESLGGGGAERSAGILSQIFTDLGHRVFVVTITDVVDYPYAGTLINLGLQKNKTNDIFNKIKRLWSFRQVIKDEKIDYVLDFRLRKNYQKEQLISQLLYHHVKVIYMVRSSNLAYYFPDFSAKTRALFTKAFSVNVLNERTADQIQVELGLDNLSVIPNPVDIKKIAVLANAKEIPGGSYILAAGRMTEDIKQFDKLIVSYAESELPKNGIALKILGQGELQAVYKKLVKALNMEAWVHFEGFHNNPFPYFKKALFFVLCSKYEGSPRVLLESLACGTPVIALDCLTGPREIIQHEKNGLLLPVNDFHTLTLAMNRLVTDQELYTRCKAAACKSVTQYDVVPVGQLWQKLLSS